MSRKLWIPSTVCLLLLLFTAEVALSTRQQSPSWDEGDHIYSGYMNWKHRAYFLNPEHPPLVKLIATLPLLPLRLKVPPRQGRYFKTEAYFGGRELLFRNSPQYGGLYSADTLLFRIHMAVFVFALTLALLVFLAGQQMFSPTAGLIALFLFVFDLTILTNAPFVTTDTPRPQPRPPSSSTPSASTPTSPSATPSSPPPPPGRPLRLARRPTNNPPNGTLFPTRMGPHSGPRTRPTRPTPRTATSIASANLPPPSNFHTA